MKDLKLFLVFLLGFAVGIVVASLCADWLRPYFPQVRKPEKEVLEGRVTAKQLEQEKLLLTVSAPTGAMLVTFSEKLSEIDLLIEEDDMITLGLHHYEPFITNPAIKRVRKAGAFEESSQASPIPDDAASPFDPGSGDSSDEPEEDVSEEDAISF